MAHLTDEQFDDILTGQGPRPAHVDECEACRARLAELEAVRRKLTSAFAGIKAGDDLAERIRQQVSQAAGAERLTAKPAPARRRILFRWLSPALAAAAVLLAAPFVLSLFSPPTAEAAQDRLVEIHRQNLSPHSEFFSDSDPAKLAEYLRKELGFSPAVPRLNAGMKLRGCCTAHFHGKPVGTYVVDTNRGIISVVIIDERPAAVGLRPSGQEGKLAFWSARKSNCNMVAVELNGYTYFALADVDESLLRELLGRLVQ